AEPVAAAPAPTVATAVFDGAALVSRFEGDRDLAVVVVEAFLDESAGLLVAIAQAIAGGDSDALRMSAHRLKGSAGHLSEQIHGLAARVEAIGRAGTVVGASDDAAALNGAMERLVPALRAFVDGV